MSNNNVFSKTKGEVQRVQMYIPVSILDKLSELAERYGSSNRTSAICNVISLAHSKAFPEYISLAKSRPSPLSAVQKATAKVEAEEAHEKAKADKAMKRLENICLMMDESSIVAHPQTGFLACQYPIYTTSSPHVVRRDVMIEDLEVLNDETPSLQYHGLFNETGAVGKEKVMAIIKKMEERGQPLVKD